MPDPDPTNRELVRVLAEHTSKLSIHTMHQFLDALDQSGYQIVPKVELEELHQKAAIIDKVLEDIALQVKAEPLTPEELAFIAIRGENG